MAIRNKTQAWAALAAGLLLVSGASLAARADDCDDCDASRWQRFCSFCKGGTNCRGCYRAVGANYQGATGGYGVFSAYYDHRDTVAYSAQGYNIPIAVPLAPCVKTTYNYGWGLPSARLTRVGMHYNQWYPNVPFSQAGGYLPAGQNPPVYQPTDTTQQGYYYVHVPRWGRYTGY